MASNFKLTKYHFYDIIIITEIHFKLNLLRGAYILEIRYSKSAIKVINLLDKNTKQRIKAGIEKLTLSPPQGDIKQLQGYSDVRFRLRIGKFRILYKYTTENNLVILNIMEIGSRGDIYK